MKWRVLVSARYEYRKRLEAAGCEVVVPAVNERLEEEELLPLIGDVDGLICGDDRVTERVLDAAKRLKVISKWGPGSTRSIKRPPPAAASPSTTRRTHSASRWPTPSSATSCCSPANSN